MRENVFIVAVSVVISVIVVFASRWITNVWKKKEERRRNSILEHIANHGNMLILLYHPEKKKVEYVTENVSLLFGIERKQVFKDVGYLFSRMGISLTDDLVQDFCKGELLLSEHEDYTLVNALDGKKQKVQVRAIPYEDGRYLLIVVDMTLEYSLIDKLQEALCAAGAEWELNRELVSYIGSSAQERLDGIASVYLEFLDMVNGVVDESRDFGLQGGCAAFEIETLIQEISQSLSEQINLREQHFVTNVSVQHGSVMGDRGKLERLLWNILENASQYTYEGGEITLTVKETETEPERAVFSIIVEDTGIGIEDDFIPRLFEPFERANHPKVQETEGRGLGLVIVRNIVELLHGKIKVESKVDKGSRFCVEVAFATCEGK